MIVVKLKGGLGNQLFQYAAARSLADISKDQVYLDIEGFIDDNLRKFELDNLNLDYRIYSGRNGIFYNKIILKLLLIISKRTKRPVFINLFNKSKILVEFGLSYYKNYFSIKPPVMLYGLFQDYRYFENIKSVLEKEIVYKEPFSDKQISLINAMRDSDSICIHVRRGDYVRNPKTQSFHGLCDVGYYEKALDFLIDKLTDPHVFVFSDDIEWVKDNINFPCKVSFVSDSDSTACEELVVMKNCKNFIISNSTFSWWPAWLSDFAPKIVCAPKQWYQDPKYKNVNPCPNEWIRF